VKGMLLRSGTLCSDERARKSEENKIKQAFKKNGYPPAIINKAAKVRTTPSQEIEHKGTVVIPYSGPLTQKLKRICNKFKIRLVATSKDTIRKRISRVAPPRNKEDTQGVVYQVPMEPCGKVYIGETGRTLKTRISEHRNALKNLSLERSGVAEHCLSCGCRPKFEDTTILAQEPNAYKRKIRETIEMEKVGSSNVGSKSIDIGQVWNQAFLRRAADRNSN
jgi:hypothetical protein